jgi:hypothetical protein
VYLSIVKGIDQFLSQSLAEQIQWLYEQGTFVMGIRYYGYKVNLYLLGDQYLEVFYHHKRDCIERIALLDTRHTRMKFYYDQIKLPATS